MNKMLVAFLVLATVGTLCVIDVNAEALCACPSEHVQVCGNDGVTYINECVARCNGATVLYNTPCPF